MKYKKIPLQVAEEDYDRVMKVLTLLDEEVEDLDLCCNGFDDIEDISNFMDYQTLRVKFRLGKHNEK